MDFLQQLYDAAKLKPDFQVTKETEKWTFNGSPAQVVTIKNQAKGISVIGRNHRTKSWAVAVVKVRTRGAGYRVILESYLTGPEVVAAVLAKAEEALTLGQQQILLPPAVPFGTKRWIASQDGLRASNVIEWAKVIKLVTVETDGRVTDDIHQPGNICWYLLDCYGTQGATFNIITDGEEFYVTDRLTNAMLQGGKTIRVKLGTNIGKASVKLDETSVADKELVNAVIEFWVNSAMEKA